MNKATRRFLSALMAFTFALSLCTALADDPTITVANPDEDETGHSTETLLQLDSTLYGNTQPQYKIKVSVPDRIWSDTDSGALDDSNFAFGSNLSGVFLVDPELVSDRDVQCVELTIKTVATTKDMLAPGVYADPAMTVKGAAFEPDGNGKAQSDMEISGVTFVIGPCLWFNSDEIKTSRNGCEIKLYLLGEGLSFNDGVGKEQFQANGYTVNDVKYNGDKELTLTLQSDNDAVSKTDWSALDLEADDEAIIKSDENIKIDYTALCVGYDSGDEEGTAGTDVEPQDGNVPEQNIPLPNADDGTDDAAEDVIGTVTVPDDGADVGEGDGAAPDIPEPPADNGEPADNGSKDTEPTDSEPADGGSDGEDNGEGNGEFPIIPVVIGVVIAVCVAAIAAAAIIILRKKDRRQQLDTINNSESVLSDLRTDTSDVEDITTVYGADDMNRQQQPMMNQQTADTLQRQEDFPAMNQNRPAPVDMPVTTPIAVPKTMPITSTLSPAPADDASAPMDVRVASFTNIGKRESQQDSKDYRLLPDGVLAVVADGMGGLADGEKVSKCVVSSMLADADSLRPGQINGVLRNLILRTNDDVNRMLGPDMIYRSGSTMVTVLVRGGYFHWASIGDSRIYLYRDGNALQVNQEHTYEVELFNRASNGDIPYEAIKKDPQRRGLTSFFGMGQLKYVDMSSRPIKLKHGDRLLLMSDGVFNRIPEDALAKIISKNEDVNRLAEALEKEVLSLNDPVQDNFTAIVIAL